MATTETAKPTIKKSKVKIALDLKEEEKDSGVYNQDLNFDHFLEYTDVDKETIETLKKDINLYNSDVTAKLGKHAVDIMGENENAKQFNVSMDFGFAQKTLTLNKEMSVPTDDGVEQQSFVTRNIVLDKNTFSDTEVNKALSTYIQKHLDNL